MSSKFVLITNVEPLGGAEPNPPSVTVTVVAVEDAINRTSQKPVFVPFLQSKKRPASPLTGASPDAYWMTVVVFPDPPTNSLYSPSMVILSDVEVNVAIKSLSP
jgi:hypothetical protein